MKRVLIAACIMMCVTSSIYAQGVGLGIKGGVNFAKQDYKSDGFSLSPDGKTGFHVGIFAPIMLSDKMGLQPEVIYSQKGSDFEIFGISAATRLAYVEIPILFRYQPIEMLSLHAAPQFGILTSAEQEVDDGTSTITTDIKDDLKGSDLSLAIGAQVDLPVGFMGGARYVLGLSDINDSDDADTEIKNSTIQIFIGWSFLGK